MNRIERGVILNTTIQKSWTLHQAQIFAEVLRFTIINAACEGMDEYNLPSNSVTVNFTPVTGYTDISSTLDHREACEGEIREIKNEVEKLIQEVMFHFRLRRAMCPDYVLNIGYAMLTQSTIVVNVNMFLTGSE